MKNSITLHLQPEQSSRLAKLCGQLNENLRLLERLLDVTIQARGFRFTISGDNPYALHQAEHLLTEFYQLNKELSPADIQLAVTDKAPSESTLITTKKKSLKPRNANQAQYIHYIRDNDINFAIGPAGTGKTYLAVACAVEALEKEWVQRIILVRPAVEAGERLGFLPGDLSQKVDPYLRPLYDALFDLMGIEKVERLIERGTIEIAPLAFMRGRTLNNAFIIMDESQNTTEEQMKMFLTRMGFGAKAVICGDITQTDLAKNVRSGLAQCCHILTNIPHISFTYFNKADIVRHPLIQKIIDAYETQENT